MERSDLAQDTGSPGVGPASTTSHGIRLQRIGGRIGRCAAAASTVWFGLTVAAMAQIQNPFEKEQGSRFKAAPKPPDAEADAAAAEAATDFILGIHVNTIFFVAAAVIGVLWFTVGGGRKPKVTQHR